MSLTDSRRMWKLAAERGRAGLHSHDARRLGISGNPSQRSKDIADHVPFWTRRESRNGRPGSRYWVDGCQPSDAVPVKPNRDVESGSVPRTPESVTEPHLLADQNPSPPAAALSITPSSPDHVGPVAILRDWDGVWRELPWDEERHRPLEEAV